MSYRSLKRVVGETKLELKLLLLFGVGLLLVIVASFSWYGTNTAELVRQQSRIMGHLLVEHVMLTTHWGAYWSKPTNFPMFGSPPEPRKNDKELEFVEYMRKQLSKENYTAEMIQPNRRQGPEAPQDDFERNLCERFLKTPPDKQADPDAPENYDERFLPATERPASQPARPAGNKAQSYGPKYQYFEPIRAQQTCLEGGCHAPPLGGSGIDPNGSGVAMAGPPSTPGTPPLAVGDVMAVAKVTMPMAVAKVTMPSGRIQKRLDGNRTDAGDLELELTPSGRIQKRLDNNWGILWATAILAVFFAMVTSYAIVRYVVVKPLRHLRNVSDAISRGNIALRAQIHTGDEFEELATAFNRMLRHLITGQEELRLANVNLDSKVDELARANMRLYEMNQIKSDFLATMSHELRTPLNSILGFSEVLGLIDALDEKQKRYVQNIQKSGRTLLDMINDILDLAKMESGKMNIRLADFRLAQVVAAQCDMARPLAEKKNIDLDIDQEPDPAPMHQDQARVQQILNNLLSNAIKFTPEGGRVTVRVRREGNDVMIQVIDTGVGIADEEQQVIFEKFRQGRVGAALGDAMTREYSGSGLGLSIVKELCKLLGGSVALFSELGKGSTFTVRLPCTLTEVERADAPRGEGPADFVKPRFEPAPEIPLPQSDG